MPSLVAACSMAPVCLTSDAIASRTIWLPAGVPSDAVEFYTGVLKKVRETPEWKAYIERSSQTDTLMTGDTLRAYIKQDQERAGEVFKREKWNLQ